MGALVPASAGIRIAESWPQLVTVSMVGGTIRRKVIHRESFRASVLHPSEIQAVLQSIAEKKCLLTRPSLLSRGTRGGVCGTDDRHQGLVLNFCGHAFDRCFRSPCFDVPFHVFASP